MAKTIVLKTKVEGGESVEKTVNAFTKLTKEVKAAKGELAKFEVGTEGYKKASAALNELQEKLGDVSDAAKITGNGFERIHGSFNLLKEGINTADFGKAKAAFSGLGAAMKAIPIFLIIEGIRFLIEKFDELKNSGGLLGTVFTAIGDAITWVTGKIEEFTNWIGLTNTEIEKQNKKQLELAATSKKASEERSAQYDRQIAEAKALGQNTVILEKQKQQAIIETSKAIIAQTLAQIKANAANGVAITKEQRELLNTEIENIKSAASKKREIENTEKKERKEKNIDIAKERAKITEDQAKENAKLISNKRDSELALLKLEQENKMKELVLNHATDEQIKEQKKIHKEQINNLTKEWSDKEIQAMKDKAKDYDKLLDEEKKKGLKSAEDLGKAISNQQQKDNAATWAHLKAQNDLIIQSKNSSAKEVFEAQKRNLALQGFAEKAALDNSQAAYEKAAEDKVKLLEEELNDASGIQALALQSKLADAQDELDLAKSNATNVAVAKLDIEKKYHLDSKKLQDDADKSRLAGISKTLNSITGLFSQFSSSIMGIYQALNETDDYNRDIQLRKLEDAYDERIDKINEKKEEELYNLENYNKQALAGEKATLDAQLENQNLTNEERALLQEASAAREAQIKIDFENTKAQIQYEADMAEYKAKLAQFEAEENLKHEAFEADKKMKMAQIAISTITGAVAAFTGMLQSIPAPYGLIAGAIAAAAVVAMGATQAAAVESTRYQKGQAPKEPREPRVVIGTGAGLSNAGAGSASPNLKDSTLYGTGGGGTGSQGGGSEGQRQMQTGPVRAYVLAGDIMSQLEAEAALKRKVTGF